MAFSDSCRVRRGTTLSFEELLRTWQKVGSSVLWLKFLTIILTCTVSVQYPHNQVCIRDESVQSISLLHYVCPSQGPTVCSFLPCLIIVITYVVS